MQLLEYCHDLRGLDQLAKPFNTNQKHIRFKRFECFLKHANFVLNFILCTLERVTGGPFMGGKRDFWPNPSVPWLPSPAFLIFNSRSVNPLLSPSSDGNGTLPPLR
jgi:hypothetical protein